MDLSPQLLALIASFTIKLIVQFRESALPDEATVAAMFEMDYQNAMAANKTLIDETRS